MIKVKIGKPIKEAEGDSKELVGINMDFLKKSNPKTPEQSPRDYYQDLTKKAEMGVEERFPKHVLDFIEKIPSQYLPETGKKYFVKWLANTLKDARTEPKYEDVRHVRDFFAGTNAAELPPTFDAAMEASDRWHEELAKTAGKSKGDYKTNDVVHDFGNGFKMVRIAHDSGDKETVDFDLKLEGKKMGNCIGTIHCSKILSSEETIYSLRDSKNEPHVSINIFNENYNQGNDDDWGWDDDEEDNSSKAGKIDEIKGRGNKPPADKYEAMVVPWILKTFKPAQYFDAEDGMVVKSKYFPQDQKEKLVLDTDDDSRNHEELVRNLVMGQVSPELLLKAYKKFTGKKNSYIVSAIVSNKNSPIEIINDYYEKIMKGEEQIGAVRSLFMSGKLTEKMLYGIFNLAEKTGENYIPLYIVDMGKAAPLDLIKKIWESKKIKKTSDVFETFARRQQKFGDLPIEWFEKYADSKVKSIRLAVAMMPGISAETFKKVFDKDAVSGKNTDDRSKLLGSGNAPEEYLEKYTEPGVGNSWDLLSIGKNEKTPLRILEKIFNQFKDAEGIAPNKYPPSGLTDIAHAVSKVIENPSFPLEKAKKLNPEKIVNTTLKSYITSAFEKREEDERKKKEAQQVTNERVYRKMLKVAGILRD